MATCNPYVSFNGRCVEAMEFYKSVFGGELTYFKVKDTPAAAQCGPNEQENVMHSSLLSGNFVFMATDMVGMNGESYIVGNSIAISVNCDSEDEINRIYNSLSKDSVIEEALKPQFWGALFASIKDKFGVRWMLNYEIKK